MRSWAATPFSSGQLQLRSTISLSIDRCSFSSNCNDVSFFWSITRIFDSQSLSSTSQLGPTSFWTAPSISQLGLTIFVNRRHAGQRQSGRLAFAVVLNRRIKSPTNGHEASWFDPIVDSCRWYFLPLSSYRRYPRRRQMGLINSNYPVVKQEIRTQGVMLVISINSNDNINNTIQCILISM